MAPKPSRMIVWFHRVRAVSWLILAVPAVVWWADSILLAILLSLYANAASDWGAAEAADNSQLLRRLDRLETKLDQLIEEIDRPK